jgi:hypothetical protein
VGASSNDTSLPAADEEKSTPGIVRIIEEIENSSERSALFPEQLRFVDETLQKT